jgi:hypothetical protein
MSHDGRPFMLPAELSEIPQELADLPNWVLWQHERTKNGSWIVKRIADAAPTTLTLAARARRDRQHFGLILPDGMAAIVLRTRRDEDDDELPTWGEEVLNASDDANGYREHSPDGIASEVFVGRVPQRVETQRGRHVDIFGPGELVPLNGYSYGRDDEKPFGRLGSLETALKLAEAHLRTRVYPHVTGIESLNDGRQDDRAAWSGWLIEGILPQGGLLQIIAPINAGKTFTAIDMGRCVEHDIPWLGHQLGHRRNRGVVLYCLSEGDANFRNRLLGWAKAHPDARRGDVADFLVSYDGLALLDDDGARLTGNLEKLDEQNRTPTLVIYDTLSGHFGRGHQSDDGDMRRFADIVRKNNQRFGCTAVVLHHPGLRDPSRGRGSEALKAAADTELRLAPERDGTITVSMTKSRDGQREAPFAIRLHTIELGYNDAFGRPATTCVVERVDAVKQAVAANPVRKPTLSPTQLKALDALQSLAAGKKRREDGCVELADHEVREVLVGTLDLSRQTASKVRIALAEHGVLTASGDAFIFQGAAQ